jgi:hypothetical protein
MFDAVFAGFTEAAPDLLDWLFQVYRVRKP